MRKTNIKTSLSITLNPNGTAFSYLKWSDLDSGKPQQAAERIVAALSHIPDYQWLEDLILPYLENKYCYKCSSYNPDTGCTSKVTEAENPFPYCFVDKET